MSAKLNFVRQQGFREATPAACGVQYSALMWQPRLMAILVLVGLILQAGPYFLALAALLWWNVILPRFNPFDALYNWLVAKRRGRGRLSPAPAPRRFAQGMAGTFMLATGLSLVSQVYWLAYALEGLLLVALGALIFGRVCAGSYLFLLFAGETDYANRTLPWSRSP